MKPISTPSSGNESGEQDGQEGRHLSGGVQVVIKVLEGAQGIEAIWPGRVFLVKREPGKRDKKRFARVRGSATVRMSTEEILRLTRGEG